MSHRKERSFDEPRYVRPKYTGGSVRRYTLVKEGEMETGSHGWQMALDFVSDLAGGGDATIVLKAKKKPQLIELVKKVRLVEQLEATALKQFRDGDVAHADFNREHAVRVREELAEAGVADLPKREWKWQGNQLIFRGQQTMF